MKKLLSIFCILILLQPLIAQNIQLQKDSISKSLKEISKVDFSNSIKADQAIEKLKKVYALSKKIKYEEGMLESGNSIMYFYYRKGQYGATIKFASDLEKEVSFRKSFKYSTISKFYRSLALSYFRLGFTDEGYKTYQNSIKYAKKIKGKDESHISLATIYNDMAIQFANTEKNPDSVSYYLFKGLKEANSISDSGQVAKLGLKKTSQILFHSAIGTYYNEISQPRQLDLARKYFLKAQEMYENSNTPMLTGNEIELLTTLSEFYFTENKYDKAIGLAEKCLMLEKQNPANPYKRKKMYEILAKSYLEKEDKTHSRIYIDLFSHISDSLNLAEKKSIKIPLSKIIEDNKRESIKQTQKILWPIAIALVIISIVMYVKIINNNKKIHENYKQLINTMMKNKDSKTTNQITNNSEQKTSLTIPDETINNILQKLKKFEESQGFLKKELTLTTLASSLNSNPKYLSEIIKIHKSKTFNAYINGLRINYITNKLFKVPIYREYKIKYLAEECGYASPQVFVIAFKKENGVTPSYYIDQLKKDYKTARS